MLLTAIYSAWWLMIQAARAQQLESGMDYIDISAPCCASADAACGCRMPFGSSFCPARLSMVTSTGNHPPAVLCLLQPPLQCNKTPPCRSDASAQLMRQQKCKVSRPCNPVPLQGWEHPGHEHDASWTLALKTAHCKVRMQKHASMWNAHAERTTAVSNAQPYKRLAASAGAAASSAWAFPSF